MSFQTTNPINGESLSGDFSESSSAEVSQACALAAEAAPFLRGKSGAEIATLLETIATHLTAARDEILARVQAETGYPDGRVQGEFGRMVGGFGAFAQVARDCSWVEATIDHAEPDRAPVPKPDLRKMLIPIGPVGIFGASNFPLALSAGGSDVTSALAAACPVVVKGHPSHAGTCDLIAKAIQAGVSAAGFPEGTYQIVQGQSNEVGEAIVQHPDIAAVGFTGSLKGGRALFDLAAQREVPIPLYAEMGSVNPQFVLPQLLDADSEKFAEGFFGSITLGNGQFCTCPGILFVPENSDAMLSKLAELAGASTGQPVLNEATAKGFTSGIEHLSSLEGVEVLGKGTLEGAAIGAPATVLKVSLVDFLKNRVALSEEVFGPSAVIVVCPSASDYQEVAAGFCGQLGASIHGTEEELLENGDLISQVERFTGRVAINAFPTGLEVCHSLVHGGPYPATTHSHFTSVGQSAVTRWARAMSYQGFPDSLLPAALQESNPLGIARRVDGTNTL
ncbi:aldehyde dehydrogenase (NADP(+)) [Akkermansiaceae bacterium]|nr:aldehyde dehydrogenase (NADP(+)) [Akkermansiaceae bacterium]MDC1206556.1 aldehyde dehydrogenase (NADP(+)) [Akkermansiaceae bacterium]